LLSFFVFIFFFQAEDGIRDRNVTGVQTCALPIYPILPVSYGLFQGLHLFCLTWHSIAIPPLVSDSAEAVKMLLPVIRFDRSVGNGVSAVDHHTIANIDTNV